MVDDLHASQESELRWVRNETDQKEQESVKKMSHSEYHNPPCLEQSKLSGNENEESFRQKWTHFDDSTLYIIVFKDIPD